MAGSQAGFGPAGLDLQTVFDPGSPATLSANSVAKCSCMSQRGTNESSGRVEVTRGWLTGHEHHDVTGSTGSACLGGSFVRSVGFRPSLWINATLSQPAAEMLRGFNDSATRRYGACQQRLIVAARVPSAGR
jgi:hypothetical protein